MAVTPVKVVAFAQDTMVMRSDRGACVQQPIAYVDCPCSASEQQWNPWFQVVSSRVRDGESPNNCDRRRVETGEVPEREHSTWNSPQLGTGCASVWTKCL